MATGGENDDQVLARMVRQYRQRAGLTQQALADMAGLSVRALRDLELGRVSRPRRGTLIRLADLLGLGDHDRRTLLGPAAGSQSAPARVEVLGPVRVRVGDAVTAIGSTPQRSLLALLALRNGGPVGLDEIVEALWGDRPPRSHRTIVQIYIGRLRQILEPQRRGRARAGTLARVAGGYQLQLPAGRLDVAEFWAEVAAGRRLADDGDHAAAAARFGVAMGLWRGPVAADTPVGQHPDAAELAAERIRAALDWSDAALACGHLQGITPTLRALVREDPMHEALHARLMLVLAAGGEQAAALATFADIRGRLADELGVQPGQELRAAQLRVLNQRAVGHRGSARPARAGEDPAPPAPAPVPEPVPEPVPAQLPADIPDFAGRTDELRCLDEIAATAGAPPTAVVIAAIAGTAGVGKTALAVHWAHQVRHDFPDGQLYLDLRGYDPRQPMEAAEALAVLLSGLGVPGPALAPGLDERIAQYRTRTTGRRLLILLDNAASTGQIRPLLPGSGSCVVLVTSRASLSGLVAGHGARRVMLDVLALDEAVGLLGGLIGPRIQAEPGSAVALARSCACLPLALRVAAELAVARPGVSLAALVAELSDVDKRLQLLSTDDERTDVQAVLSWSYGHLSTETAQAFQLLGLHPGSDLDASAAAAALAVPPAEARRRLDALVRVHLASVTEDAMYWQHDLLRAYARARAATQASAGSATPRAMIRRLLDHYLASATAAVHALFPHQQPGTQPPPTGDGWSPDPRQARAWLDRERTNLVAACGHAAEHGWPAHALTLGDVLHRYLEIGAHYHDGVSVHTAALRAALALGDRSRQAQALYRLGVARSRLGEYDEGVRRLTESLALVEELGDDHRIAEVLKSLSTVDFHQGRSDSALTRLNRALALFQAVGDVPGQAGVLNNLGALNGRLGRYAEALDRFGEALDLHRQMGDRSGEGMALTNIGEAYAQLGRHDEAISHELHALHLFQEIGERAGAAEVLYHLGMAHQRCARPAEAYAYHRAALDEFRTVGDRLQEACASNGLGEAALALGEPEVSLGHHTAALEIATAVAGRFEQARAHDGIAHAHLARSETSAALHAWQAALDLYAALGAPEAAAIRRRLTAAAQVATPGSPST